MTASSVRVLVRQCRPVAALALCGLVVALLSSCQTLAETIYKGRPPNPPPEYFSGDEAVVVHVHQWVHPHVFEGYYVIDGREYLDRFIQIEEVRGFYLDSKDVAHFPVWVGSADIPDSSAEQRCANASRYPPGTPVLVSFPLRGKKIWDAMQGAIDAEEGYDVCNYTGYLIRIEGWPL